MNSFDCIIVWLISQFLICELADYFIFRLLLSYAIIEHMNTTIDNLTWRETADRIRESRIGKYEIWVHEAVNIMACIPDADDGSIELKRDILHAIEHIDGMDDFNVNGIKQYRTELSPVLKRIIPFMEQVDGNISHSYEQGEETTDYSEILFA